MANSDLRLDVQSLKRVEMVTAVGRIDSSNAMEFDDTLKGITNAGRHNIVLDLAGVNYMSSAGLRAMVAALRECKKNRGNVVLAQPSERVAEVLSLAGLDSLFSMYGDATTAVGSF